MTIAALAGVRPTRLSLVSLIAALGLPTTAAADKLASAREVARGGYYAPRFAPDGAEVLVTGPKHQGLYLAKLNGGSIRRIADDEAAGVHARFRADGAIEFRAVRAGERRDLVIARDGGLRAATLQAPAIALEQNERIYVRRAGGALEQVGTGDRFFAPQVSPDGDKVAFQGLASGIHLYVRSTGRLIYVGPGTAPAWSPDGSRLIYELTEDDGHEIVASELRLYDVAADRAHVLTTTDKLIERRPSFSPDGRSVAFDDDTGAIWVARLEEGR